MTPKIRRFIETALSAAEDVKALSDEEIAEAKEEIARGVALPTTLYDISVVRQRIRQESARYGNLKRLSVVWGVPYSYISAALHTDRAPSPLVLSKLKLRRVKVMRFEAVE